MKVVVVGAGAMGGSYGGFISEAGHEVLLVDTWSEHVGAINRDGLRISGARGEKTVRIPAVTAPPAGTAADLAIVFVDSNATAEAARTVGDVLGPDGVAITSQNGIGNVEKLQAVLGEDRVLGGSSMASAARIGAGHVAYTHEGPTSIGETAGGGSERVETVAGLLREAGFEVKIEADVMAKIWTKFVLNCSINALCATTGLRIGEVYRLPEMDALQDRIIEEVLAVTAAKGITLQSPDIREDIKRQGRLKFSKPSMMQHVEAGRRTEIDAINGALVREAAALGIATPCNEALVALLKGRELERIRRVHEPDLDYEQWEREVAAD